MILFDRKAAIHKLHCGRWWELQKIISTSSLSKLTPGSLFRATLQLQTSAASDWESLTHQNECQDLIPDGNSQSVIFILVLSVYLLSDHLNKPPCFLDGAPESKLAASSPVTNPHVDTCNSWAADIKLQSTVNPSDILYYDTKIGQELSALTAWVGNKALLRSFLIPLHAPQMTVTEKW